MDLFEYKEIYRSNLLEDVIPLWTSNSEDKEFGGFFTCLDEVGKVYDTDKFMWLQCRQIWTLSMLYNRVEKKQEWVDMAERGAEFVMKNGYDLYITGGQNLYMADIKLNPPKRNR